MIKMSWLEKLRSCVEMSMLGEERVSRELTKCILFSNWGEAMKVTCDSLERQITK